MIDFSLPPELLALRSRTADFIQRVVIPEERHYDEHRIISEERLTALRSQAQAAGLYAPHVSKDWGGLGLTMREIAVVFEEAGHSLLGPYALNCAAPDEGNMHLLEVVATPAQQERYLRPLVAGTIRSCFAMTEPPPGAGADPSLLRTSAQRQGQGWIINGTKWYITGAEGASFAICMARTHEGSASNSVRQPEATLFLVDTDNPGFRIKRLIPSLDANFLGGHAEIEFRDCFVPEEAVLGSVGAGFSCAQIRLAPARLTHCMRWLGAAQRALDHATTYVSTRESFGHTLGQHQMVQTMLADSVTDIHAARLMIWHAAWVLDSGGAGRYETSLTKTFVAEAVNRVIDRAIQMCGSLGISHDLPLALLYRSARPFRIYDGPSEVHRGVIARQLLKDRARTLSAHTSLEAAESDKANLAVFSGQEGQL